MRRFVLALAVLLGTTGVVGAGQWTYVEATLTYPGSNHEFRVVIYEWFGPFKNEIETVEDYVGPTHIGGNYYKWVRPADDVNANDAATAVTGDIEFRTMTGGTWSDWENFNPSYGHEFNYTESP